MNIGFKKCNADVRRLVLCLLAIPVMVSANAPQKLEIHYINVGQGGSTLIIGPDGTSILYDFGNYNGTRDITPYLDKIDGLKKKGIDYTVLSHNDRDHYNGYRGIIDDGYQINIANFFSGDNKGRRGLIRSQYFNPSTKTRAGPPLAIPVGLNLSIGDGATVRVISANGRVFGLEKNIMSSNKNDASIALLVSYKNFQYMLDGDLGAGREKCTFHQTSQKNIQGHVAKQLIAEGFLDSSRGIDVMHIAHHGSESSTSAEYYNLMMPEVGIISVGKDNKKYLHPRRDVVEGVLFGNNRAECVTAPPLQLLLQTERGEEGNSRTGSSINIGIIAGDIVVTTDGEKTYRITGSGRVHTDDQADPNEPSQSWTVCLDEHPDCDQQ